MIISVDSCSMVEEVEFLSYLLVVDCHQHSIYRIDRKQFSQVMNTRGPRYRSPECIGYAELEQAWKYMTICCISFHPCRSIRKQIWPNHKNGQGQSSVIIGTNLVVLEYPMLYSRFQCHRPLSSEEGDFSRFLPYTGDSLYLKVHGTGQNASRYL